MDLCAPLAGGRAAVEIAALAGRPDAVHLLVSLGCPSPAPSPVDALVGAALAADAGAVARLRSAHPSALTAALRAHPGLVVRAVAAGNADAVGLLVALGFSVDGLGRADLPIDQAWETGLHHAAGNGDVPLVRALLDLGADASVIDARFGGTPLDRAVRFDHADVVDLLSPG